MLLFFFEQDCFSGAFKVFKFELRDLLSLQAIVCSQGRLLVGFKRFSVKTMFAKQYESYYMTKEKGAYANFLNSVLQQ